MWFQKETEHMWAWKSVSSQPRWRKTFGVRNAFIQMQIFKWWRGETTQSLEKMSFLLKYLKTPTTKYSGFSSLHQWFVDWRCFTSCLMFHPGTVAPWPMLLLSSWLSEQQQLDIYKLYPVTGGTTWDQPHLTGTRYRTSLSDLTRWRLALFCESTGTCLRIAPWW